jgi:hypothetical protein
MGISDPNIRITRDFAGVTGLGRMTICVRNPARVAVPFSECSKVGGVPPRHPAPGSQMFAHCKWVSARDDLCIV